MQGGGEEKLELEEEERSRGSKMMFPGGRKPSWRHANCWSELFTLKVRDSDFA